MHLALSNKVLKAPNSQNGHSPMWPLQCSQPWGISSDVVSHRHNAHKTKEVQPYDFQVSLTCSKYPNLFHSCGPDTDAIYNY